MFERMHKGPVRYTGALEPLYHQYEKERAYVELGLEEAALFANQGEGLGDWKRT
jgi:hypothetical protein